MSMRLPGINAQEKSASGPAVGETAPEQGSSFIAELAGAGAQNLAPLPTNRRFGGFLLLGIVVLVAGAVLVGMRFLGTNGARELLNIKIDYPIGDMVPTTSDHAAVLQDLKDSESVVQIPLESLRQNPFAWNGFEEPEPVESGSRTEDPAELTRRSAEQRRQKLNTALAQLTLNSVLGGPRPMARISGTLLQVGDTVAEYFKITSISGRTVELSADGQSFTLSMNE